MFLGRLKNWKYLRIMGDDMGKRDIGVFICNYNKKEYLLKNLAALEKQTARDIIDICVVDNASTDGAPDEVESKFPDVRVIRNKENLGGAGGFHKALVTGEKEEYSYLLLADNDIVADENAIYEMKTFLDEHPDVGMVGAKVYLMDEPERIWIYGNYIDFENFKMIDGYAGQIDDESLPEVVYCDTVPSCFSLIHTKCLKKTGYMPEENFITWDDIEWCHRFGLSGYKVCSIASARVWHKTGGRTVTNHFGTYYYNRNKWHFFSKFIEDKAIDSFITKTIEEIFIKTYGFYRKGLPNAAAAFMIAFTDYLSGVKGKAADASLLPFDKQNDKIKDALAKNEYTILFDCNSEDYLVNTLIALINYLKDSLPFSINLMGSAEEKEAVRKRINDAIDETKDIEVDEAERREYCIIICNHVNEIREYNPQRVYIDRWFNMISTEDDFIYFRNTQNMKDYFFGVFEPIMRQRVEKIRENKDV